MDAQTTEQVAASQDAGNSEHKGSMSNGLSSSTSDGTTKEVGHNFQRAISAWKSIDLGNLVPQLDKIAAEVIDNQKEAVIQRKDLAQKTKDYRKLDDAAKLSEFKGLLKAYQNFIDLLTNHQKTSSSGFLQVYSTVSEAPDPYPLLEASVESLVVSEDVPKISAENEKLQGTLRERTRIVEDLEAKLLREQSLRRDLEQSREQKAQEIEASWQSVLNESKENWEVKERALEEKIENQERLFSEIKASFEVSQRLGQGGSTSNAQASASAAELELLNSDLERTSARLAELESKNEQLRVELAQAASSGPQKSDIESEPAFARLQSENTKLLRQIDAVRLDKDSEARKWESRIKTLEREVQRANQDGEELRQKLSKWRDYPELKRELDVFKALEFSTGDDDEAADAEGSAVEVNGSAKKDSLEQLLLARNKKLSDEMAVMRVSLQTLRRDLEQSQENASVVNAELERVQHLNATLENDLLNLQSESANQFSSGRSVAGSRYPNSSWGRGRRSSPTSSIISGFDSPRGGSGMFDSPPEAMGGGSGMLPLVQAQRDRFKQKISQLEAELSKQYSAVSSLRQEVQSLQKDNLNLYEKTRYVSTYQRQPASSSATSAYAAPATSASTLRGADDAGTSSGLTMDRYRSQYEANISPFAAFRGREATRAYRRMSLPERVVYNVTRLVLSSRTSRNLFATYCLALHLLGFMMLYWMSSVNVEKHASNLGDVAGAAAGLAGGAAGELPAGGAEPHHGEWHQEGVEGAVND